MPEQKAVVRVLTESLRECKSAAIANTKLALAHARRAVKIERRIEKLTQRAA